MKKLSTLSDAMAYFSNEENAIQYYANLRWPDGVVPCCRCESTRTRFMKNQLKWKCDDCKKQFSIRVGTGLAYSKLPVGTWLKAAWLLNNRKNGINSYQLARDLGISQSAAWNLLIRLRYGMAEKSPDKFGGTNEADEAYTGGKRHFMHKKKKKKLPKGRGTVGKNAVMGILNRDTKKVVAMVINKVDTQTLHAIIHQTVKPGSIVYTDGLASYEGLNQYYTHESVAHSKGEYVRGDVHTNGIEGFWAMLKRVILGTHIGVSTHHLVRYVDEQVFRYNEMNSSDSERVDKVMKNLQGKRVPYQELIIPKEKKSYGKEAEKGRRSHRGKATGLQ